MWRTGMAFLLGTVLLLPSAAAPRAVEARWTLLLQLPEAGPLVAERAGGSLRGSPATLVTRLRRGDLGSVRRLRLGTVSLESRRIRELAIAGRMLIVTVAVRGGKRVHAVSTNRMPVSADPAHLTLVNLQLVAEGELNARAPFAVVDERGRTAVLFQ